MDQEKNVEKGGKSEGDTMYEMVGGKPSNAALHEAIMEDVEDDNEDIIAFLIADGASEEIISLYR